MLTTCSLLHPLEKYWNAFLKVRMSIWNQNLYGVLYSRDSSIFLSKGHSKFPQFPIKTQKLLKKQSLMAESPPLSPSPSIWKFPEASG